VRQDSRVGPLIERLEHMSGISRRWWHFRGMTGGLHSTVLRSFWCLRWFASVSLSLVASSGIPHRCCPRRHQYIAAVVVVCKRWGQWLGCCWSSVSLSSRCVRSSSSVAASLSSISSLDSHLQHHLLRRLWFVAAAEVCGGWGR